MTAVPKGYGLEQRGHKAPLHDRLRPETLREKAANRRRALLQTALHEGEGGDVRRWVWPAKDSGVGQCVYHRTVTIDGHCTDCSALEASLAPRA